MRSHLEYIWHVEYIVEYLNIVLASETSESELLIYGVDLPML